MTTLFNMDDPWSRMRKFSLIISGPKEGCTYKREDFLPALQNIVGGKLGSYIVSFGPLAKNFEWHLVVKDQATKDRFMTTACLDVKGFSFRVRSADRTQFIVRVHWGAGCVPNEAIHDVLSQYGTVMTSANEQSTVAGFEGVSTGIRSVVMSGNREVIPHILQAADPATGEVYKLLCVINGRKPPCLKCQKVGHYRRDCFTPRCRFCDQFGHGSEECSAKKSYAAAPKRDIVESEYDTEEEMEIPSAQVTKPRKSRYAYTKSKTGLIEPVIVTDGPSPSVESTPRWSRCPNQVRTVTLPRRPTPALSVGKLSMGETSGNVRNRQWCQIQRSFLCIRQPLQIWSHW